MAKVKYLVFSNDVAPARDGMYQRQVNICDKLKWLWNKYENGTWYVGYPDYYVAKHTKYRSHWQVGEKSNISPYNWRGLAEKPKGM